MAKKLVIAGASAFGEIACEYFTHDSDYEVAGFAVEERYIDRNEVMGLPVVKFEEVEKHFDPSAHSMFVALTYVQLNRARTRLYHEAKAKGYRMASYVSSHAFVWRNANVGENCFIFEDNTVQPFVDIGDNVILWSGNHIGHHSTIRDNCFISSHVVVSGFCEIGESSFLGVNATIANNVKVGRDCFIGAGALIHKDTGDNTVFQTSGTEPSKVSAQRLFKVKG